MYLYTDMFKIWGTVNIVFKVPHVFHYHNSCLATGGTHQQFDCSSLYHGASLYHTIHWVLQVYGLV